MPINPYQPPKGEPEAAADDPLALPATGCFVGSVAGIVWASVMVVLGIRFVLGGKELESEGLIREGYDLVMAATWLVVLCGLATMAGYSMRHRRRRWLVVLATIIGMTPLGGMFSIPLAAVVALRLRRPDVWNSFK